MMSTAFLIATISSIGLLSLAGLAFAVACRLENRGDRVFALLYHRLSTEEEYARIEPRDERIFAIPEGRFRDHMNYLCTNGYHPVGPDALLGYLEGREGSIQQHSVLITFDDGCESVYARALPILREFRFPAIVFVTTSPNARVFKEGNAAQRRVTDEEIRELAAGGVEIGSHSVTHRPLGAMDSEEVGHELAESKRYLEGVLGRPVRYFGVPFNWYGKRVREAAARTGYSAVFTSDCGTVRRGSDPLHLKRITIEGSCSVKDFANSLRASSIVQRRLVGAVKRLPARLLGPRMWMPIRASLFQTPLGYLLPQRYFRWLALAVIVALALSLGFALYVVIG